jgi:hypothetical protein
VAAVLPEWPVEQPAVTADDLEMVVTINTSADMTGWTFEAAIRRTPTGPIVAHWTVAFDAAARKVTLTLPEPEAAKVEAGFGFDLRQTAPENYTWLSVRSLNLLPSFSYEGA